LDYGHIFDKTEAELAALNHEFVKFFSAAHAKNENQAIADLKISVKDVGGWMTHAMYLSLGLKYDLRDLLKTIPAPVLVLHGQEDIFSSEISREYARLIPDADYVEMEEASHFLFNEKPVQFSLLIADFFHTSNKNH
jgi:proline iminopeptidase